MKTMLSTYISTCMRNLLDMIKKRLAAMMQLCTKVASAYFSIYEY